MRFLSKYTTGTRAARWACRGPAGSVMALPWAHDKTRSPPLASLKMKCGGVVEGNVEQGGEGRIEAT
jgi:hypothetical protein